MTGSISTAFISSILNLFAAATSFPEPLPTTKYDTYPTQAGIKGINVGRKIGVEQATVEKAQKDVVNLDFTKKSGREVVSFKNITPNARKTIGEDIVVGKFGVAKEMYNKSDFWRQQKPMYTR